MTMATDEQVDEFIALIDEARPVQLFHHIDEATVGAGGIMRMLCCAKVGDDPVTAGAIAEELHVSTARVAALLKNMEAKGLISRERAASDARVTVVTLTPHGRALADAAYRNVRNHAPPSLIRWVSRGSGRFSRPPGISAPLLAPPRFLWTRRMAGERRLRPTARSRPNTPDGQNDSCGLYLHVNIS